MGLIISLYILMLVNSFSKEDAGIYARPLTSTTRTPQSYSPLLTHSSGHADAGGPPPPPESCGSSRDGEDDTNTMTSPEGATNGFICDCDPE